jgi:hypothetical protein
MTPFGCGEDGSTRPGDAAVDAFVFTRKDRGLPAMVGLFLVARREEPLGLVGP